MPRLNWLFDLGLVDLDAKSNVSMTPEGLRLFKHICCWCDMIFERVVSPDCFLDNFASAMFADVYRMHNQPYNKDGNEDVKKLTDYIRESFDLFKTLAPNRVTASQAIHYAKYSLWFKDNISIEFKEISDWLESAEQNIFIMKMQKKQKDGYIQKRG